MGGILLVDLHTHILPNIDDGAESLSDALEMVSLAQSNGTTDIVLTPHYLLRDRRLRLLSKDEILYKFDVFKAKVKERYPDVRLYSGAEMFAVNNVEDVINDKQLITINNSRYVLVEFSFNDSLARTLEVVSKLVSFGLVPIIAHPERYDFLKEKPTDAEVFLQRQALLQINTTSLFGLSGEEAQKTAIQFLERKWVSFASSDAHNPYHRTPDLLEGYSFVATNFGETVANDIFSNNPLAVIKEIEK